MKRIVPMPALLLPLMLVMALAACKQQPSLTAIDSPAPLTVVFADASWTGDKVPAGMQCKRYGGRDSASPALVVGNIPAGADALVVQFNDLSYQPLSRNGGHGSIKVAVPAGAAQVTVPSVPGETYDVPAGVEIYKPHRATGGSMGKGAYLPPCSGGRGNTYVADVLAVDSAKGMILGTARIKLGTY